MTWLRSTALSCLTFAFFAVPGGPASAQTARTIKLVVPFPAGGTADTLARLVVDEIGKTHGVTILIETRPGAGATIAYDAVARAAPDGNTLVINGNSLVINPSIRKVNYDPLTSFEPICYLVKSPQVIAVNAVSPYRTLGDLVAAARARPGELSFAGTGPGAAQHIGIESFKRVADINLVYVPYPGGAPAVNALLGGHVTAVLQNYSEVAEQLKSDKLRALATTSLSRIEHLPDVPTVAESGYKEYQLEVWFGVLAPAKTPPEMTAQLASWFTAALQAPEVTPKLINLGLYPVAICGTAYKAHLQKELDTYRRVIGEANIKGE